MNIILEDQILKQIDMLNQRQKNIVENDKYYLRLDESCKIATQITNLAIVLMIGGMNNDNKTTENNRKCNV